MDSAKRAAMEEALKLLARREHSALELAEKLSPRHETEVLDAVILHLTEAGFISEKRVVEMTVAKLREKRSAGDLAFRQKLGRLGISEESIESVLNTTLPPELDRAWELVAQKYKTPADLAKIGRFLASRGFEESTIESVLDRISWSEPE